MYQLKKGVESFDIVDGPHAGQQFRRGQVYKTVPPDVQNKFEKVEDKSERKKDKGKAD